ncbi:MAG: hypothetical protein JSU01_16350 [Bacteroidetes bacterium]|nr:hypothetical protein [Bacteroidota bacterium]
MSGKIDLTKTIYCYTDKISYMAGDSVSLYISGPKSKSQTVAMTDMNDHTILSVNVPIDIQQIQADRPWLNGLGFTKTITIKLPDDLKSGIYKFCGKQNIVVRNNSSFCDITVIYPSNTDNAYNQSGRRSLYAPDQPDRSTVVSFLRFQFGSVDYSSSFFKWLSLQDSYNINYISDADLDDYSQLERSKLVIITGHSEYWTRRARQNIDKFVASGKNLLVLAGDVMWWQVRYNLKKNIMICYRDKAIDPLGNTPYSTVLWSDASLKYSILSSIGADFNHGGYANQVPKAWNGYKIVNQGSPLFKGTGLKNGDILKLPTYECDGAPVVKMIKPGSNEIPVIDNSKLKFLRVELLAYDFAVDANAKGLATFIVFQKTKTSGTVVNVATENWCSNTGIGGDDKVKIETITKNMIDNSLSGSSLF